MSLLAQPRRFGAVNWLGLATLAWREGRRGLKDYNYQLLGPIVSALLYLAIFHLAWSTIGAGGAAAMLAFIAPGLVVFVACEKAFENACGSLIFDKHERVIADLLMAPLSPIERVLGYLGGACAAGWVVGAAVAIAALLFAPLGLHDPLALVFFGLMGTVLHSLIGILVGIWAEKWDSYAAIHTFLLLPLAFLSGLFYRVQDLPALGQALLLFNPVFYVIDGFRYGVSGEAAASLGKGAVVLVAVNLALFVLAWVWLRRGYRLKP
ncbi:ABC-2 type transport system permease protein [Dongia mobilis]|uniref:Transport permease protein n=1 Tax=Dongia mobilis TaxID=578943 RepID=A0A4V3DDY6_9PROT|nr:ABC transporter permease [Dongia mobilis]TDQ78501.1 ABC-2 type transport system permease protein [Dongia mobilis]